MARPFLTAFAGLLLSGTFASATVIIDDFSSASGMFVCEKGGSRCAGSGGGEQTTLIGGLGNSRFVTADRLTGRGGVDVTTNPASLYPPITGAALNYHSAPGAIGFVTVIWAPISFDLTATGLEHFSFDWYSDGNGGGFWDAVACSGPIFKGACAGSSYSLGSGSIGDQGPGYGHTQVDVGSSPVLSSISGIQFTFNGHQGANVSFDNFAFSAAEPDVDRIDRIGLGAFDLPPSQALAPDQSGRMKRTGIAPRTLT